MSDRLPGAFETYAGLLARGQICQTAPPRAPRQTWPVGRRPEDASNVEVLFESGGHRGLVTPRVKNGPVLPGGPGARGARARPSQIWRIASAERGGPTVNAPTDCLKCVDISPERLESRV